MTVTLEAENPDAKPALAVRLARATRRAGRVLLDVVYPPVCLACRAAVTEPGVLCAACWTSMRFIERPYCERLGIPFTHDLGYGIVSPEAIADPPAYRKARAVARYEEGPSSKLVHRLKYADRCEIALPMGRWMARAGAELLADADMLVPIPLHRRRLFLRRFNQAALLSQAIAEVLPLEIESEALRRVRATTPQVGLTRAQRASNVQGAFRVEKEHRDRLTGRRIVLVDDVLTSGATTDAAARALLRAGAAHVDVLVFASVVTAGQISI